MKIFRLKFYKAQFIFVAFVFSFIAAQGQPITKVMGKVVDANTLEPLPFVNIAFKESTIGTTTDFDGNYAIETKQISDSIIASYVGYHKQAKAVVKGRFQTIDFYLQPTNLELPEVVIKYTGNPADVLIKKVIENKPNNNREKINYYQYESYNKIEFDANNLTEKFRKQRALRQFAFIFDNIDTSTVNGKSYLPLFLSESVSDVYFRKFPKTRKEIIKASKISGLENESITQLLGDMYQNINIYDNFINLFDKNFVSPIASVAFLYYRYYLIDSTFIDNQWCYHLMFKPKRKQELTFTGNLWVHDTTFAIKQFELNIADDANINFIHDLYAKQEFVFLENKYWLPYKEQLVVDFNIIENTKTTMGFFGKKTTTYRNYIIDEPPSGKVFNTALDIIVADSATKRTEAYWNIIRHEPLSKDELGIYTMIDTITQIPKFQTYANLAQTLFTGYKVWGLFEWGPYYKTLSFNEIEGTRIRFGGRSSNDFSTKLMLEAHVAYGFKDEQVKYSLGGLQLLSKNPRRGLGLYYKHDMEQLGQSTFALKEDNFIASVFRRNPADKLSMVNQWNAFYDHEWFMGFSNKISFVHREMFPVGTNPFVFLKENAEPKKTIITSDIILETRFAYREKILMGEFERVSLGSKYPIIELTYVHGLKNFWNSDYTYKKLQLNVSHWFNVGTYGYSKYIFEAGRVFGTLPYPLLKLHEGNETYSFDEYAFNTMNYYEFVSDKYLSFYYTHHFDGYFFNKIPFFRKLKWREVGYVRGLVGNLSENNRIYSQFPTSLHRLSKPYFEYGTGIENIFKVMRVDGIWRLSYLDHPDISLFGLRLTFQLYF